MEQPYTYYICWAKENLHYYGVRYAKGATPKDLWTEYHTSSKKVKELRESIGEPDIIEVRKEFKTRQQAIDWEHRVLKRLGVIKRDDWLNEACGRAREWTEKQRKTLSNQMKGKSWASNRKENHSKSMKVWWSKNFNLKEQQRKRMLGNTYGFNTKGIKRTIKQNKNNSDRMVGNNNGSGNLGKVQTIEHKQKISESLKKYWQKRKMVKG